MIRRHLSPRIGRVSIIALAIAVLGLVAGALAYFSSSGSSTARAAIGTLDTPSLTANDGAGTVSLSWSAVTNPASGAVKYYVTRDGGAPGGDCPTSAAPSTSTSCTDSGMSVGSHTYKVIAVWRTWSATSSGAQVTVASGALDHFTLSAAANATAGTAFNVTLTAKDAAGNTVTSYSGTAHFTSSDGQASLPSDYTFVSGDSGSHQFSVTLKTAGSKTVSAADTVHTGVTGTATVSVAAAGPSKLVFTSSALSGTASNNSTLGPATVQQQDAFGNPATTATATTVSLSSNSTGTVKFSTTSGGGSVASVSIAAGSTSANFFYGDTKAGSPTITASNGSLTSATQQETINAAGVSKFAFISSAVSGTASSTANLGPITIQEQDTFGNPTTTAENGINLSSTGTEVFSATQNGSAITSVSIPSGSSTASFYYGNRTAGTQTITAQRFTLSGSQQETISAADPSKLVFTSAALSGSASATANLGPATVQEQDQFGNPTTSAETVSLSSGSPGSPVFATSLNGTGVTSISIAAGSSSASFYYGDTKAGSATVTAQASGLTSATQNETVNAGTVNKLVFTTAALSGNTSTTANLGPATIQEQDQFGNPTTTAETNIGLSSSSGTGHFSLTQNGSSITSVSISSGSSVTFWYGDSKPGTPTITATKTPLTAATQQETIQSTVQKLVITSSAVSGAASSTANLGPITVQEQDNAGNPTTSAETVTLSSNSTGTAVFSATQNGVSTTSVSIPAGSSSATFYYGDTKAGTPTITAAANGLTSGTQQETINAAAASTMAIVSGTPQTATVSAAFANPFVVKVTDTFGNAVSGASVTFSGPSSGASGTFSSSGCTSRPFNYQCVVSTNTSGQATSSTFTANSTPGKYNVSASAAGTSGVNFALTNAVTVASTSAGTHVLTVPAHVTSVDFTLNGGGGGGSRSGGTGGDGGSVSGTLALPDSSSATTFNVRIAAGGVGTSSGTGGAGGAGYSTGGTGGNGSSNGAGGGGGGASAIYTGTNTSIVVVGGGAGSGGRSSTASSGGAGGDGSGGALSNPGTSTGASGADGGSGTHGFGGITTTTGSLPFAVANTGGAAGTGGAGGATAGTAGAGCLGGDGGDATNGGGGGGGGGGLACGGGAAAASGGGSASGGGGGSGYTGGTSTYTVTVNTVTTAANGGTSSSTGGAGSVTFSAAGAITLS